MIGVSLGPTEAEDDENPMMDNENTGESAGIVKREPQVSKMQYHIMPILLTNSFAA